MSSYLNNSDANTLAATMVNVAKFLAAITAKQDAALLMASLRFDTARQYQGRKYDLTQDLEFPRVAYSSGAFPPSQQYPVSQQYPFAGPGGVVGAEIWDWDKDNNVAIVPLRVKMAIVFEANSILLGDRDERLQAIADGLASQSIGSVSESYRANLTALSIPVLCKDADLISRFYELVTGENR